MRDQIFNQSNNNAALAHREAGNASDHANQARQNKGRFEWLDTKLTAWAGFLASSPIMVFNFFFLVCFCVDIMVSWEMYREVVSYALKPEPFWAILSVGLIINGMAVVVSHHFSMVLSPGLLDVETWNHIHLRNNGNYALELA